MPKAGVARDIQAWFAGEYHSLPHDGTVPWVEPRRLMPIQSYPMAGMVSNGLSQTRSFDRLPGDIVNFAACYSWPEFVERSILCLQHGREISYNLGARLSDDDGSFQLARVTSHLYACLADEDIAPPDLTL